MGEYDVTSLMFLCESLRKAPSEIHTIELLFFKTFLLEFEIPKETDDEEGLPPDDVDKIRQLSVEIKRTPIASAYARRGQEYYLLRRLEEAMADCEHALSLNPDSIRALRVRAQINGERKKWKLCSKDLGIAQSIDYCDKMNELHKLSVKKCEGVPRVNKLCKNNSHEDKQDESEQYEKQPCKVEVSSARDANGSDAPHLPDFQSLMKNIPPGILEAAQNMMNDPEQLRQMLQNPMFEQMIGK